jgi:radical SAM protein with 4Fe4S-binding SPASM domain
MSGFEGACRLGDLERGINPAARAPFARYTAEKSLGCYTSCSECRARPLCGGGCLAKAYERSGLFQLPDPFEQKFTVIVAEIVEQLYSVLAAEDPPAFRRMRERLGVEVPCV